MKLRIEIVGIQKQAAAVTFVNLSLALLAIVQGLQEGSTGWTLYICLASLQGVAIGFLAGPAWSDRLLGRTPSHRKINAIIGFAWSVVTYWAPILATFVFGLILAKTLPDAARPRSSLEGNNGACGFQSWVMAFCAVGCTWLTVWLDARKALGEGSAE